MYFPYSLWNRGYSALKEKTMSTWHGKVCTYLALRGLPEKLFFSSAKFCWCWCWALRHAMYMGPLHRSAWKKPSNKLKSRHCRCTYHPNTHGETFLAKRVQNLGRENVAVKVAEKTRKKLRKKRGKSWGKNGGGENRFFFKYLRN
jgi:hypothetical protein